MPRIKRKQKELIIKELFTDIEGEGRFQGLPSFFVRLTGCNLRCSWCDTKYSYKGGLLLSAAYIAGLIKASGLKYVNITGGEPLLQKTPVIELIRAIKKTDKSITVSVETNGSVSILKVPADNISMDWKLPGSGESKKMLPANLKALRPQDQLKLVAADEADLDHAKKLLKKNPVKALVVVQPVSGKYNIKKIADYVLLNRLNWKVSLQMHKFL